MFWRLRPDLVELLVDAIPLLTRRKDSTLNVFRNAGVPSKIMSEVRHGARRAIAEIHESNEPE